MIDIDGDDLTGGFDDQINESWREFTDDLAARLGDLKVGEFEFIEISCPTGPLVIAYTPTSARKVRCAVPDDALGAAGESLRAHHRRQLAALGWEYISSARRHQREFDRRRLHSASIQSITLLRGMWGVAHPTFLTLRDPFGSVHPRPRV